MKSFKFQFKLSLSLKLPEMVAFGHSQGVFTFMYAKKKNYAQLSKVKMALRKLKTNKCILRMKKRERRVPKAGKNEPDASE